MSGHVKSNPTPGDLAEYVSKNVEAIAALDDREGKDLTPLQRAVERIAGVVGRPGTAIVLVGLIAIWMIVNSNAHPWDPPPFPWMQGAVGIGALLTSVLVVARQNRQAKLAERWAHLDLQVNLLAEQRTAKLISLIEELRRDLPTVRDRRDPEAEAMETAADPRVVLSALQATLDARVPSEDDDSPPPDR